MRALILLWASLCFALDTSEVPAPFGQRPALGTRVVQVQNATFQVGHLTVLFQKGQAAPIMLGDLEVGIFFRGEGRFDYQSTLPEEQAVMAYNLNKARSVKAETTPTGASVADSFKTLALWGAGTPLPELQGEAASFSKDDWEMAFRILHEGFRDKDEPFGAPLPLALQAMNAPKAAMAGMLAEGGKNAWFHYYDGVETLEENLYVMTRGEGVLVSRQPVGWHLKSPLGPSYRLVHLDVNLDMDDKLGGRLKIKETILPMVAGLRVLSFDLIKVNRDDNGYPRHRLIAVRDGEGRILPCLQDTQRVQVFLPEPTHQGKPLDLHFEIRDPYMEQYWLHYYREMGVFPWFPQPTRFSGHHYTVRATMKVPRPYYPMMPGDTVRREEGKDFRLLETRFDKPVMFFTMHAGNYFVTEVKKDGLTVRVASSKVMGGKEARLANIAHQMIKGFETFLGPFPFNELNVVLRPDDVDHGQAPPGAILLTGLAFYGGPDANILIAHEIAHQWWGHVVKMPSDEEQWLTEAFAEYCAALMLRNTKGQGQKAYDKAWEGWGRGSKNSLGTCSVALANRVRNSHTPKESSLLRKELLYDKGALILGRIHKILGDRAFFMFLRGMTSSFNGRFATTLDVTDGLKAVSGKDFGAYLDRCYWGTEEPASKL